MKKLLLVLSLAVVAVAAPVASAGGWATVGLSSLPPSGLEPNQAWPVDITVLQHGQTPLAGVTPIVRIRNDGGELVKSFTAKPTGKTGVYHAVVDSPAKARTPTRSTTASAPTAAPRRIRSSPSRWRPRRFVPLPPAGAGSGARSRGGRGDGGLPAAGREPEPVTNLREAA